MVVQDEFLTFTATYADVVLPASPHLKKTVLLQILNVVFNVYTKRSNLFGDSKPDWKIFQAIANRLGFDWNYSILVKLWMK
ncbi:molybdopterin-dependent oxidoreductase [Staphylococcus aureus]